MAKHVLSPGSTAYMPASRPEDKRKIREVKEALEQYQSTQQQMDDRFTQIASQEDFPVPLLKLPGQDERPLTPELASILERVADLLSSGKAVCMMTCDTQLTTQEAADMLGVSRPTLVKLLEDGQIPFTKVGRHRRIRLDDLQEYANRRHTEHVRMFDELNEDVDVDLTVDNPLIRE